MIEDIEILFILHLGKRELLDSFGFLCHINDSQILKSCLMILTESLLRRMLKDSSSGLPLHQEITSMHPWCSYPRCFFHCGWKVSIAIRMYCSDFVVIVNLQAFKILYGVFCLDVLLEVLHQTKCSQNEMDHTNWNMDPIEKLVGLFIRDCMQRRPIPVLPLKRALHKPFWDLVIVLKCTTKVDIVPDFICWQDP